MSDEADANARERTELAVARTTLAIERTFNAWIKTALAFLAGGLGLVALMEERIEGAHGAVIVVGAGILVGLSILITANAALRYRRRMTQFGTRKLDHWPFWVIRATTGGLVIVSLVGLYCLAMLLNG